MRRSVVLLVVLAGVVSGCAQPTGGTAFPVPSAPPAAEVPVSPTAPPPPDLPPRPREVRLDGLDPCTLLTEADRAELGLDQEPLLTVAPSGLYGGELSLCTVRGFEPRAITVAVLLPVTAGIELYFRPGVRSEITQIEVQDFPAVVAVPTTLRDFCTVVVDVAPGQAVHTQVSNGGRLPPIPQATLCRDAERVAGIVMENLLAVR